MRNNENIGSGPSRNRGIEAAQGEYLSFVDPDDRIAPDFYELLYTKAVSGNFDIVKGTRINVDMISGRTQAENLNRKIRYCLWKGDPLFCCFTYQHMTAIYRRSLFDDKTVRYGTGRNDQDTTFLLNVRKKTQRIAFEDSAVYYYSVRPGSATSSFTERRCRNELDSFREKIGILLKDQPDRYDMQYVDDRLISYISNICRGVSEGSVSKEREAVITGLLVRQLSRIPEWAHSKK